MVTVTIEKVSRKEMERLQGLYLDEQKELMNGVSLDADWDKPPHGLTLLPVENPERPFQGYRTINVYIRNDLTKEDTQKAIAHEMYHVVQWLTRSKVEEKNIIDIEKHMFMGLIQKK